MGVFGKAVVAAGMIALCASSRAEERVGIYDYPRLHIPQTMLRLRLMQCVRAGDITNMEQVCRQGLALMPGDATWQYNLACALAYRATPDAALDALDKAVADGFRDAAAIENDNDLKRISSNLRFKEIVQKARETADLPVPGRPKPARARLTPGTRLVLVERNLLWDFDRGIYTALFSFLHGNSESAEARAARYAGPAADMLKTWLADGTAAGNSGDVYVNRDRDHSRIKTGDFPALSELRFEAKARRKDVDKAIPNTLYPGAAVVGNASLAVTMTNGTRSLVRNAMGNPQEMLALQQCYADNQFWVFPAHKDYDPEIGKDLFSGMTPCALMSVGSSGSDRYFVRAALAVSAAFGAETKKHLLDGKLFAPTMQWLMRSTRKGVESEADYFSEKAHPTAFDRQSLDVERMVKLAHSLKPAAVPPTALPFSVFVPVKPTDLEKELDFRFSAFPAGSRDVSFTWHVVHGDVKRVKITPGAGGAVHLSVDCRELAGRVDVACFAKTATSGWGAPSFISIYPLKPAETGE